MSDFKPILCLDFDGVLHSYCSGWKGADVIPDAMVPGAVEFLDKTVERYSVNIHSSRSHQPNGIYAMQFWLKINLYRSLDKQRADEIFDAISWPTNKPPALLTIDDRAVTFTGVFPSMEDISSFRPWYKKGEE